MVSHDAHLWHTLTQQEVADILSTNSMRGLTEKEVDRRHEIYGTNHFQKSRRDTLLRRVARQFKSPLVFILLFAGIGTLFLQEFVDAIVIFIALAINVIVGTLQEERAGRAFEKISQSQEHDATVIRDGRKQVIPAALVVPGDVVVLVAGSAIPADIRLTSTDDFEANEATLTGEWLSVAKSTGPVSGKTLLADQRNMAWMGTLVAAGAGEGIVVATGRKTKLGTIAEALGSSGDVATPIQKSIRRLARFLSFLIGGVTAFIFIIGLLRGEPVTDMLLLAIAVIVSVIPEGLPAAVTIVLAIGMEKILSRGGLVRNLLAAETLGSTTVILTDKTGTLTKAQMAVSEIVPLSRVVEHSEDVARADEHTLLRMAVLTSDGFVEERQGATQKNGHERETLSIRGRPVERAIVRAGLSSGLSRPDLLSGEAEIAFLPFDSTRRFAASLNRTGSHTARLYISGAPEALLAHATRALRDGQQVILSDTDRKRLREVQEEKSAAGLRLIAIAVADVSWERIPDAVVEEGIKRLPDLTFGGFLVLADPLRGDVPGAIATACAAGARVIMLTGDNIKTARSIARAAGIAAEGDGALDGGALADMSDGELSEALKTTTVFARVLPEQKLRIARLLQQHGEVVAMTGDGINDAPALRRADIGIAVGTGTEVAKEASDLVLLESSFAVIVAAIEEGRRIIDNLKKIAAQLLSTSFGEVFIILGAFAFALPLPILPTQILWVNLVEGGLLNFAFAFEPAEGKVMARHPHSRDVHRILTREVKLLIGWAGALAGLVVLGLFLMLISRGTPIEVVRTMVFAALSFDGIVFALSLKVLRQPVWMSKFRSNVFLLISLAVSIGLLIAALTVPALRTLLSLTTLSSADIWLLVGVALINLFIIEIAKHIIFRRRP